MPLKLPTSLNPRRVVAEFNDRSKFVYICDAQYVSPARFYSLYYEIERDKLWEIAFGFNSGCIEGVCDYTRCILGGRGLPAYDRDEVLAEIEKIKNSKKT